MATFKGSDTVAPGLYFNAREIRFVSMDDGGVLPGDATDRYRAVHPLALFVVGPFVGLVYAIFLPLIAFVMIGAVLVRKAAEAVGHLGHRPTEAHAAAGAAGGDVTPKDAPKPASRDGKGDRS